jgi:predicted CXXCH cytochrome family protein
MNRARRELPTANYRLRIVAVIMIGSLPVLAGWALGGIEGSKHDFSHEDWSGGNPCSVCHVAENGEPPAEAPLWDADADLNRTFGVSLEESKKAGLGTTVCIRCHDGTIARDTVGGSKRERFANKEHRGLFQAGHESSEHPVGVDYPLHEKGYKPMVAVLAKGTVSLPAGKVECVSCHDPHDMTGLEHMLVDTNGRSRLCLTCHRK